MGFYQTAKTFIGTVVGVSLKTRDKISARGKIKVRIAAVPRQQQQHQDQQQFAQTPASAARSLEKNKGKRQENKRNVPAAEVVRFPAVCECCNWQEVEFVWFAVGSAETHRRTAVAPLSLEGFRKSYFRLSAWWRDSRCQNSNQLLTVPVWPSGNKL